jgi:hypothetical protein
MNIKPSTEGFAGTLARVPVRALGDELVSHTAGDDEIMPQPVATFENRFTAVWNN